MSLNDHRVRKNGKQFVERVEMVGRFEDPLFQRGTRLEMLQKSPLKGVGGMQAGRLQELFVRRHPAGRNEFLGHQRKAVDSRAFMWCHCAHWIDLVSSRRKPS